MHISIYNKGPLLVNSHIDKKPLIHLNINIHDDDDNNNNINRNIQTLK